MRSVNIVDLGRIFGNCYLPAMAILLILIQLAWSQTSVLEGRWQQPCQNMVIREELFNSAKVTLTEFYYADGTCNTPLLTFRNQGLFQADNGQIDFSFEKVLMTAHWPAVVADFNARKVCGFDDWRSGEEKLVAGLSCEIFGQGAGIVVPAAGQKRFGIYKINGDLLYFGRLTPELDALSPEKRPTELDPRFYIRKL